HLAADTVLYRPALTGQSLRHEQEKTAVGLDMADKNANGLFHQLVRLQHIGAGFPHHPPQHQAELVHQLQPEVVHVTEMTVEGRRNHAGLAGDLTDTETGEMPALADQLQRGCHQLVPGLARFSSCFFDPLFIRPLLVDHSPAHIPLVNFDNKCTHPGKIKYLLLVISSQGFATDCPPPNSCVQSYTLVNTCTQHLCRWEDKPCCQNSKTVPPCAGWASSCSTGKTPLPFLTRCWPPLIRCWFGNMCRPVSSASRPKPQIPRRLP